MGRENGRSHSSNNRIKEDCKRYHGRSIRDRSPLRRSPSTDTYYYESAGSQTRDRNRSQNGGANGGRSQNNGDSIPESRLSYGSENQDYGRNRSQDAVEVKRSSKGQLNDRKINSKFSIQMIGRNFYHESLRIVTLHTFYTFLYAIELFISQDKKKTGTLSQTSLHPGT